MFVLEGVRLVLDALRGGTELALALYVPAQLAQTEGGRALLARLERLPQAQAASERALAAAADTVQPQGVVALAPWPQIAPGRPGLVLVLDAIQDPGNMGTLLRSAEAVSVAEVLCVKGTVDVYSPKVVRAGMGAHLRLAVDQDLSWETVAERLAFIDHVYAADAGGALPYYAVDWRQPTALIIGSEARGLHEQALVLAHGRIGIPMRGQAESLNAAVAGSIILFEAQRQRMLGRS